MNCVDKERYRTFDNVKYICINVHMPTKYPSLCQKWKDFILYLNVDVFDRENKIYKLFFRKIYLLITSIHDIYALTVCNRERIIMWMRTYINTLFADLVFRSFFFLFLTVWIVNLYTITWISFYLSIFLFLLLLEWNKKETISFCDLW